MKIPCPILLSASLAWLAASAGAATGATNGVATDTAAPVIDDLTEVLVTAPERLFVAPTTRDRIGRIWVPVHIDGRGPYRLVLDTGAQRSALSTELTRELGLATDRSPPVLLRGVTGSAIAPTIEVQDLAVGELSVGRSVMPVVEHVFGDAQGLLGTDGMQSHRIAIDFRYDFIHISRSRNRSAEAGYATLPFLPDRTNLLMVRASVAGVPVRAVIDTGAQATVGNGALRDALRRQVARGNRGIDRILGATGEEQTGVGARMPSIRLGDVQVTDAHVTFSDLRIFDTWQLGDEPALLVGMDLIGLLDALVIDYRRRELHLLPRQAIGRGRFQRPPT